MKWLKGFYHSFLWALEMKRRAVYERELFGSINPESITDIDRFLRDRKMIP